MKINASPEVYREWSALCARTGQIPANRRAYLDGLALLFPLDRWLVGRVAQGEPLEMVRCEDGAQCPIPFDPEDDPCSPSSCR